jgi:DtxR family Mn-dependent transcriptional regulator
MVDPVVALLAFALLVLVSAVLGWPRRGLLPRAMNLLRQTERVRLEDVLKHLYNCEYAGTRATVESVAGALAVSRAKAVRLLARLDELGLARPDAGGSSLTDGGRAYALRVVRTHRLWERYLADRTGVKAVDWHEHAERREHTLRASEAEDLAAELGHPLYDPHGDPIPTADGELPPRSGVALTSLRPGTRATVVHLEDEPREVYERLVAEGLTPLVRVEVLESEPGTIRFQLGGQERVLEPVVASSVTVRPIERKGGREGQVRRLDELRVGEAARVVGISQACQGPQRRRLLDLGVVPGTIVRAELVSPGGDPVAYEIRGALVALREEQASWIEVEDAEDAADNK